MCKLIKLVLPFVILFILLFIALNPRRYIGLTYEDIVFFVTIMSSWVVAVVFIFILYKVGTKRGWFNLDDNNKD
jgi:hypothetical protein